MFLSNLNFFFCKHKRAKVYKKFFLDSPAESPGAGVIGSRPHLPSAARLHSAGPGSPLPPQLPSATPAPLCRPDLRGSARALPGTGASRHSDKMRPQREGWVPAGFRTFPLLHQSTDSVSDGEERITRKKNHMS